jgi:hypothetical protein
MPFGNEPDDAGGEKRPERDEDGAPINRTLPAERR